MASGETALIVGVGTKLSASVARLCYKQGMKVALASRNVDKLADLAEDVADELGKIQGHYKKKLVLYVREFKQDCADFRADF